MLIALAIVLLFVVLLLQIVLLLRGRPADPAAALKERLGETERLMEDRITSAVRDEFARSREEAARTAREGRQELAGAVSVFAEAALQRHQALMDIAQRQAEAIAIRMTGLADTQQARFDQLRTSVEDKLAGIRQENACQLEQMRATVDEKLQGTLEKRLGESFQLVSERLERVHKGLGEMQSLASGVGDLKRVLTNVKARGTWGEVQLGALIEEVLTPDQFGTNVATTGTGERVEFAIKLPGHDADAPIWLPIDAKFPLADYERLLAAHEAADATAAETAGKALEARVRDCAEDIRNKYLAPPTTTDFGILFLPVEGLFSEVVRRPGLCESIQREYRVVIAGPTTLWAVLTSLQVGFRTLAIEKRSSEVWQLLAEVKTEWLKYGEALDKVQVAFGRVARSLDRVNVRSRAVGRKLRNVEQLPASETPLAEADVASEEIVGDESVAASA
jgi:DNA recombination protein RmuC